MTLGHQAALRLSPSGSCAELYCLASRPAPGLSAWAQLRPCAVVADAAQQQREAFKAPHSRFSS